MEYRDAYTAGIKLAVAAFGRIPVTAEFLQQLRGTAKEVGKQMLTTPLKQMSVPGTLSPAEAVNLLRKLRRHMRTVGRLPETVAEPWGWDRVLPISNRLDAKLRTLGLRS